MRRISGSVNSGPREVVVLGVEADRDAVGEPPAAARALVRAGLADRLDRQALDLGALAVARDARGAGVDDVADARDGERRLGDVGGQDDPPPVVPGEDAVLLGGGQPAEQRKHLGGGQVQRAERLRGVPDLPLAGEEHEDVLAAAVAPRLGPELLDGLDDPGDLVDRLRALLLTLQRAVADLDRVGAARHLDDRHRPPRRREVVGEPLRVDRRRGDDHLEVGPAGQEALEVAEEEVDVEAPLVGLVDDDRVVAPQVTVALDLGEQDAVGHHLDQRVARRVVGEPHLVADGAAQLDPELLGDALGDRPGGDPAGLGVADGPLDAAAELEADLRQLGRLARAGLAGDDDDLVVADGRGDVVAALTDRQVLGIGDLGDQRAAPRELLLGHGRTPVVG